MLTNRELEILELLAKGHTCGEIGLILNIAETTVISHREKMKEKLQAKNSCNLILNAVIMGFLP